MAGDQQKFQTAMTHAERFSQEGDWPEAIKAYRYALAEFPNNEAAVMGFGKASLASGQTEFALRAFQQILKINPTSQDALISIGGIQEQLGQLDAAAETYLRVGNMRLSKMDPEGAMNFWRQAIELVPHHTESHRRLADGLGQQGQTRLAARQLLALAAVFQQQHDRDQALQQVQAAEQLVSDDPGIDAAYEALQNGFPIDPEGIAPEASPQQAEPAPEFYTEDVVPDSAPADDDPFAFDDRLESEDAPKKGLLETMQQEALTELANVVFEDDSNPQHTMLIIQALDLQGTGKLFEAASNYRQAVQGGMKQASLFFNLGVLWNELGEFDHAVEMLNVAAQDGKYGLGAQLALGETYQGADKTDVALRHFVEVLRQVDMSTVGSQKAQELFQYYGHLARNYVTEGDPVKISSFISSVKKFFAHPAWERRLHEARQLMDGVTDNGVMSLAEYLETPQTEVVVKAMALTNQYLSRNLLMTASEECLRAIQKAPDHLPLHIRLADILLKQDHTDEAIAKYLYIAKVYQMRGTPEDTIEVYHKILRLAPMDVNVRASLIDMYTAQQNNEQALEQYLMLADSYYQLAQVDRALEKYNEALRLTTNASDATRWKAEILSRMGDIYNQRFDWAGATMAYEELNKIKPNDDTIQRQLIDFYYKQNKVDQASTALDTLLGLYQRQNPMKSIEFLKDLSSGRPEDMYLRQRMAIAYAQNGMTREAIAEYDALGEMQLEKGLRNEAIQTIRAIINLGPDDTEGYKRLLTQISGGAM